MYSKYVGRRRGLQILKIHECMHEGTAINNYLIFGHNVNILRVTGGFLSTSKEFLSRASPHVFNHGV
jgi:hypothetical protein